MDKSREIQIHVSDKNLKKKEMGTSLLKGSLHEDVRTSA